eukprot:TRINITY_DN244_c0_g1_i1.p1 TRINITY_DN244_c0_g1~~TRINITY_DN244_c0_g1_i1.p1  ORF type:complete len:660 (+),score=166.69 TRINITY_DN244_c0_g1_i1:56-1981(+)
MSLARPCGGARWLHVLLISVLAVVVASTGSGSELVKAIDAAQSEEEARVLLEPEMGNLKIWDSQVLEKVVMRQWWNLAREVVAKSHEQKVDLSFAVRKAVRSIKDEADELLRTLNPKYGQAQQVAPAFQWAQNESSIFLTIKYTVRWNAPGALEVSAPSVNMTGNLFNFSGLGKHSNNKYFYFLSVNLFDNIDAELSTWSAASVGKLSVTLRKKWARKWPRLLADKKTKIGNMHVWMEMQEKLDSSLSGMSSVSNSPVTCGASGKLYCVATDTCKKLDGCAQCPGKSEADEKAHLCAGKPTEKAGLSFQDSDMDEHQIGGEVKITKAKNDFDVDSYAIFWGKSDAAKLESESRENFFVGEVNARSDLELKIPQNSKIPEGATHLLVFSRNSHGEYATPGAVLVKDASLPKAKPGGLEFSDEDGGKDLVKGRVTILKAENEDKLAEYSLHWGKSATRKTSSNSFITDVKKAEEGKDVTHWISSQKPPDGASHILAFSKNEFGEYPSPANIQLVDATKACLKFGEDSCAVGVQITADEDPDPRQVQAKITITPAKSDEKIHKYRLFWGKEACTKDVGQNAKNGHIRDVQKDELEVELPPDTMVPEGTKHLLVFVTSVRLGDSDYCVSTPFEDDKSRESDKKEL